MYELCRLKSYECVQGAYAVSCRGCGVDCGVWQVAWTRYQRCYWCSCCTHHYAKYLKSAGTASSCTTCKQGSILGTWYRTRNVTVTWGCMMCAVMWRPATKAIALFWRHMLTYLSCCAKQNRTETGLAPQLVCSSYDVALPIQHFSYVGTVVLCAHPLRSVTVKYLNHSQ